MNCVRAIVVETMVITRAAHSKGGFHIGRGGGLYKGGDKWCLGRVCDVKIWKIGSEVGASKCKPLRTFKKPKK